MSAQQFGKYVLTNRLASGATTEVFKAELTGVQGFNRPIVVKRILPEHAQNDAFITKLVAQAKIAVSLSHSNIVPIFELGRIKDDYFIASEFVPGRPLDEVLQAAKRLWLSVEHAVLVAVEICKGLDYAHGRQDATGKAFTHGSLNPRAVLVTLAGEVRIDDFGIAHAARLLHTTDGPAEQIFSYQAPEQFDGATCDQRADIFACGALLFEMLTGKKPFTGNGQHAGQPVPSRSDAPRPSFVNTKVPKELDAVLLKALATDPSQRFVSANELREALSRFLLSVGSSASARTLSQYLTQLFPNEDVPEDSRRLPLAPEPQVMDGSSGTDSNGTQSYAVRADLIRSAPQAKKRGPRITTGVHASTGRKQSSTPQRTLNLPVLTPDEMLEPLDDVGQAEFGSTRGDDDTEVDIKPSPDVPAFQPSPGDARTESTLVEAAPASLAHAGDAEAVDEEVDAAFASLAPDDEPPAPATAPPAARERYSKPSDIFARFDRQRTTGRKRRISQMLSGTMSLFVQDTGHQNTQTADIPTGAGEISQGNTTSGWSDQSGSARMLRPTLLGWIAIAIIFTSSAGFVLYKKTTLFRADDLHADGDLLLDDIAAVDLKEEKEPIKSGRIKLTSRPAGATFFLHVGDTPITVEGLAEDKKHVFRVEREGYRTSYQVVGADAFAGGIASAHVTLEPVTGKEEVMPPEYPAEVADGNGRVKLVSNPPSAAVWRVIGKDPVALPDLPAKYYYFMALLPGHQPDYINVSETEFSESGITIDKMADLTPEETTDEATTNEIEPDDAKVASRRVEEPKAAAAAVTKQSKPVQAKKLRSRQAGATHAAKSKKQKTRRRKSAARAARSRKKSPRRRKKRSSLQDA